MWWAVQYRVATSLTAVFSTDSHLETGKDGRGEDDGPCQHALETCLRQLWSMQAEVGRDNFQTLSSFSFFVVVRYDLIMKMETLTRDSQYLKVNHTLTRSPQSPQTQSTHIAKFLTHQLYTLDSRQLDRIEYNEIILRFFVQQKLNLDIETDFVHHQGIRGHTR